MFPSTNSKLCFKKKNVGPFEASMGTTTLVDIVISPRDSWCCVHASQTVIANILSVHYHTVPACSCNNYTETKVIISSIHIYYYIIDNPGLSIISLYIINNPYVLACHYIVIFHNRWSVLTRLKNSGEKIPPIEPPSAHRPRRPNLGPEKKCSLVPYIYSFWLVVQ